MKLHYNNWDFHFNIKSCKSCFATEKVKKIIPHTFKAEHYDASHKQMIGSVHKYLTNFLQVYPGFISFNKYYNNTTT